MWKVQTTAARSRAGLIAALASAVFGMTSGPARAGLIVASLSGTVTSVDASLNGSFSVGQTLTATYVFESTTAARAGGTSTFAVFDALKSLSFSIGGYTATSLGAPEIQVDNDPPLPNHDRYGVVSRTSEGLTGPAVAGQALQTFLFRMDDSTNAVFNNALTLPTSVSLASFDSSQFFVFFGTAPSLVSGTLRSFTTRPVPEPGGLALGLIGTGALALVGLARRRSVKV